MYFKAGNHWTPNVKDAMDFRHILLALDFAFTLKALQLDLLVDFGDLRYDVRLKLQSS
jgi:hypothetical protein